MRRDCNAKTHAHREKTARRGVTVIGIGNWGSSLVAALADAGLLAERVHVRSAVRKARSPKRSGPRLDARVLWLAVPDAAIAETAAWLVARRCTLRGQVVVHSSGALNRTVLAAAEQAGARTASVHPMMSFPTRRVVALAGTRFGVEADNKTQRELFALIRRLGGRPFAIAGEGKAIYHAGAMFGSPFVVAVLAAGVGAMGEAGIAEKEALALLAPMAAATVANVQKQGLARSFSGPLARGDAETVKVHRRALAGHPLDQFSCMCGRTVESPCGLSARKGHAERHSAAHSIRNTALLAQVYDALARIAASELPSADRDAILTALSGSVAENRSRRSGTALPRLRR